MNTSSLSSNHNNTTIFSLNSSTNEICCSHQAQYQSLYQQLSSLRIEHRALKHQNAAFKNTTRGLQEENGLLKQFLNSKKEMVNKLNHELEKSQKEIDRLQDELEKKCREGEEFQSKWQQTKKEMERIKQDFDSNKDHGKEYQKKCQTLELQLQKIKQEFKVRLQETKRQKVEQISRISLSLENAFNNMVQHDQRQSGQCKKQSPLKTKNKDVRLIRQNNHCNSAAYYNSISLLDTTISNQNPVVNQLTNLIAQYKQHQFKLSQQISEKTTTIKNLQTSINSLQSQLSSSLQLLNQRTNQIQTLRRKNQELQDKCLKMSSKGEEHRKIRDRIRSNVVKIMGKIIKQCIGDSDSVIDKILALILSQNQEQMSNTEYDPDKTSSKAFQCQILLHQLQNIATNTHSQSLKTSLHSHQLERLSLDYSQLKQNYELLTLKFNTLHREYQHVIQDNNRLIKYNSLSKYRISRNVKEAGVGIASSRCDSRGCTPVEKKGPRRYWNQNKENVEVNNYDLSANL